MKTSTAKKPELPATQSVKQTVRERLRTFEQDKKTASPWADVKRRILERPLES